MAFIFFTKPFTDYTAEDFKALVATNLGGFLYVTQLAIKQMLAQKTGGSIVTITAALARNPIRGVKENTMMKPCEHLQDLTAADFPPPRTPGACEECLKEGTRWVELRECQACGHVGCCDSSPGKHATKHFHEAGHPVMRSVMPGATWTWCYVHEAEGRLG